MGICVHLIKEPVYLAVLWRRIGTSHVSVSQAMLEFIVVLLYVMVTVVSQVCVLLLRLVDVIVVKWVVNAR